MNSNIFIPEKIKVGYQERRDTYTGKLAYVIYFDEKGKLRKEASWSGWRDKNINPEDFENKPTSGFVLNKKAGGDRYGWNPRQTYVRVYDPRGFEFEITIPNLLYILENTNSIKGKGLEGEFVYGWDGTELVLVPTESPDYEEITKYNSLVHANTSIKAKDLIVGATYKNKQNEEWIYMGRFDYYKGENEYDSFRRENKYSINNKGKYYFFTQENNWNKKTIDLKIIKSLDDKFIECISTECVHNFADLFDKLEKNQYYSPLDENKNQYIPYTFEEFKTKIDKNNYMRVYDSSYKNRIISKNTTDNTYRYEYEKGLFHYTDYKYDSLENIFELMQPKYLVRYLANGKEYDSSK